MSAVTVNLAFTGNETVAKTLIVGPDAPAILIGLSVGEGPSHLVIDMEAAGVSRSELSYIFKLLSSGFNQEEASE